MIVVVAPAAMVDAGAAVITYGSVPMTADDEMIASPVPLFLIVMVRSGLVVLYRTFPNSPSPDVTASAGAVPVPESAMSSGDDGSLLTMRRIAVLAAAEVGLKTTETVVVAPPPAMVVAGAVEMENFVGSGFAPPVMIVADEMVAVATAAPEFVMVTELGLLAVL